MSIPEPLATSQSEDDDFLDDTLPLPGSIAGRRIVRLGIAGQSFRQDAPLEPLFTALGFVPAQPGWRYDRARALEWFLAELKALPYSWVQDPWEPSATPGQEQPVPRDAGPRPAGGGGGGPTQGRPLQTR